MFTPPPSPLPPQTRPGCDRAPSRSLLPLSEADLDPRDRSPSPAPSSDDSTSRSSSPYSQYSYVDNDAIVTSVPTLSKHLTRRSLSVNLKAASSTAQSQPGSPCTPRLKPKSSRSIKLTMILVPITLVLIALYTRFASHPAALDAFTPFSPKHDLQWGLHERHGQSEGIARRALPSSFDMAVARKRAEARIQHREDILAQALPAPVDLGAAVSKPRMIVRQDSSTNPTPTVPSSPVLPTPFPQPFDTTMSTNFSTQSCYNFFLNMTQTQPFRDCRPFSLLLLHSDKFITSQRDINALNVDIYGTCNTATSASQCQSNMVWFAGQLKAACQTDIADNNEMASSTLYGLEAYTLMRNSACATNPSTNAYCYIEAVATQDQSSYYFYELPVGMPLAVDITNQACNDCNKNLMDSYASALQSSPDTMLGLNGTYEDAASKLVGSCGAGYVDTSIKPSSNSALPQGAVNGLLVAAIAAVVGIVLT
ncbi:hypothetical protein CONPUDRAFT_136073 [Coniophora puteana RWD-64-598 SS2]|uniref:DUF7729 domain-containing protein n=1 Tax=Coniophora puteana (strain RWD-64-598) TaxID=741705 RepID=A0A5M3MUX4_CONPW|nr:uncharacterized protein CONPUDRAFT_136073 [Coniophora puteana RWD-64-598 SS2]EIW82840.1 hypothetical protein CONPUDRAFT_136073 [Coniophora puteana RWD-64-598 SS2]